MKHMKHAARLLLQIVLVFAMLPMTVFAADEDLLQIALMETSGGAQTQISTNATVTDGVVTLTYDSDKLTYEGIEVTEAYVAMYAVNAEEKGTVKISWVAPGPFDPVAEGANLIRVNFSGEAAGASVYLTGTATSGDGKATDVEASAAIDPPVEVDKTKLEALAKAAQELDSKAYTEESWAALESALTKAKEVLADPDVTQAEVDAAEKVLSDALNALVAITKPTPGTGTTPASGDSFMPALFVGAMVISAMVAAALVIAKKRRNMR